MTGGRTPTGRIAMAERAPRAAPPTAGTGGRFASPLERALRGRPATPRATGRPAGTRASTRAPRAAAARGWTAMSEGRMKAPTLTPPSSPRTRVSTRSSRRSERRHARLSSLRSPGRSWASPIDSSSWCPASRARRPHPTRRRSRSTSPFPTGSRSSPRTPRLPMRWSFLSAITSTRLRSRSSRQRAISS